MTPETLSSTPLKVVADENIPLLAEFFSGFGEIVTHPGRTMTPEDVADADVLLVRSVTRVNAALLAESSVKFVATATSGTDHIDKAWLKEQGIGFASAAGCNAVAVVDYVLAVLDTLMEEERFSLEGKTVGIVGYGQVGSRLYRRFTSLGIRCLVCDPFRDVPEGGVTIDELVTQSDILSLHTPLTRDGDYPTWHLLNEQRLSQLKPKAVLIAAGRGDVVDNSALIKLLRSGKGIIAALDVWEHEPALSTELLDLVAIGTPHIAGYSVDGKVLGTAMIYQSLCEFLQQPSPIQCGDVAPVPLLQSLTMTGGSREELTAAAVRLVYDVRRDDARLRSASKRCQGNAAAFAREFDVLRRNYPKRREFSTLKLRLPEAPPAVRDYLRGFGFQVEN